MGEPGFTPGNILWVLGFFAAIGALGWLWNWWKEASEIQKDVAAESAGAGCGGYLLIFFVIFWALLILGWILEAFGVFD